MTGRVVVIASGETERRALPRLMSHLRERGAQLVDVRIPPGHRALDAAMAEKLVRAAWFGGAPPPPDKFVVLIDTDRSDPEERLRALQGPLAPRLAGVVGAPVLFAYAQPHLEAWYFADAENLRQFLRGRALGKIDASRPDELDNPKLRLANLLGPQLYTASVSEEIAGRVNPETIRARSPSFRGFVDAAMNGAG